MNTLRAFLCLLGLVAFASSSRIYGKCDFEAEGDICGLGGSHDFTQGNGRPSWNLNAMDSGYTGSGYLLLTGYNSESRLETPTLSATVGDETVNFAYFLNGEGEADSYISLYSRIDGVDNLIWEAVNKENRWEYVTVDLNVTVGHTFQVVWKARADRNIWTTQHTWLGLDSIEVVNEGGAKKCFRPPPVQYANPWLCSSKAQHVLRPDLKEELSDGTICTTSCLSGFLAQGEPVLTCNNGQWTENDGVVFMCIDGEAPQFLTCPSTIDVTTPFGWGSMWYTITPPEVSDNTNAWVLELFLDDVQQTDTTVTAALTPGNYNVKFVATDFNYNVNTCSYTVTVFSGDQNPPTVLECPNSQSIESSSPLVVGWPEPVFSDDSGYIANVESTYDPTSIMAWGRHEVVYTAYDNSSNTATCSFTVTVKGIPCNTLSLPILGALVCHDSYSGRFCVSMCGEDGDFEVSSPELTVPNDYLCSTSGSWFPYEFIYNCGSAYGETPIKGPEFYFSGACNETSTQSVMKSQALTIFNVADTDPILGDDLTPDDFYVTCGPRL
ncbi:LOW QUALITY PROTEIN: uncharacterized protein LOC119579792 [Penaeus monodon]|uniref:LOW QUALITY PROTEIN: uncharacterized protein LOC119579792 n=1 Tax=Penaeus monodon TaxID=6687 RepID=UPI0018A7C060|nr:LOW QUALITY PROTEIN: uncharacterized protein LOC119579792 [Penaeus monodon]